MWIFLLAVHNQKSHDMTNIAYHLSPNMAYLFPVVCLVYGEFFSRSK